MSLLLARDLAWFALLLFLIVMSVAALAATRHTGEADRRQ